MCPVARGCRKLPGNLQGRAAFLGKVRSPAIEICLIVVLVWSEVQMLA
ncbi:MAG: hypothetical protein ABI180_12935 [Microcoleus sp.]